MRAFGLTEKHSWPECREILVEGELDLAVCEQLRTALARAIEPGHRYVLVDLDRCEFIDVSALELLLSAHAQLAQEDRELLVFGASGQVRRLFTHTKSIEYRFLLRGAGGIASAALSRS